MLQVPVRSPGKRAWAGRLEARTTADATVWQNPCYSRRRAAARRGGRGTLRRLKTLARRTTIDRDGVNRVYKYDYFVDSS